MPAAYFTVAGFPSSDVAGEVHAVTVTPRNSDGTVDTAYNGFFRLSSSDPFATMPETTYLYGGSGGPYNVTLYTAGTRSITVTDTSNSAIKGSQTGIVVNPATMSQFIVNGVTSPATAGTARNVTVTAADAFGNTTKSYTGQVHFTSTDPIAVLPANSTLSNGVGTFSITPKTAGTQMFTVTDTVNSALTGTLSAVPQMASVYSQAPGTSGAHEKSAWYPPDGLDGDQYVWDSFVLPTGQAINQLQWRGCYTNYLSGAGTSPVFAFDVYFCSSMASGTQPDIISTPLAHYHITGNASETPVGVFGGYQMYDYQFTLPTAFTAAAGSKYWVEIVASQGLTPFYYWPPDWSLAYSSTTTGSHFREIIGGSLGGGNAFQTITGDIAFTLLSSSMAPGLVVNPAATSKLVVSGFPSPIIAGSADNILVTATDAYGNLTPTYTNTVHVTSSDSAAILPPDTALVDGSALLPVTLMTPGTHSITATDVGTVSINGSQTGIVVQSGTLPPIVADMTINAGAVQRSRVTSLTVTFDQPVTLPANPADAFQLKRQGDNAPVALSASVVGNAVTLTFTGGAVQFGSLADGKYTLTALASQINAGNFDGNGDGIAGDDYILVGDTTTNKLFRFFGDADGNGLVDGVDFGQFRNAFNTNSNIFDFDGNGVVDGTDFGQFRQRFGVVI